uniref:RRM domain-containing protein n=1 Tax=Dunaliella tertiolecta TaxID=3047 RepID=A0A6S8I3C5_DUNTE|mmetsp:Transcript_12308/g.33588  ORF Transcript_12308/g.33588 Transcript_12308/m.33588 type:complete len:233 (+) Transcript_12308:756-1454(+)
MRYEEDGEYAIRKLDGMEWGYKKRPLRLQWSKMKEADRQRHVRPTTTLFVVNFDAARTRTRDLERLFEKYGPLRRVEIKRNYAFVQYDTIDDAEYALKKTNATVLLGRTITVEFCQNEAPGGRSARSYSRSPVGRRGRSPTPSRSPPRRRGRSPTPSRSRSRSPRRGRSVTPSRSPVRERSVSRSPRRSRSRSITPSRSPPPKRRSVSRSPSRSRSPPPKGRSPSRSPSRSR